MQKYSPISDDEPNMREDSEGGTYYWCGDADVRIAELENALREAIPYIYIPGSAAREIELSERLSRVLMEPCSR